MSDHGLPRGEEAYSYDNICPSRPHSVPMSRDPGGGRGKPDFKPLPGTDGWQVNPGSCEPFPIAAWSTGPRASDQPHRPSPGLAERGGRGVRVACVACGTFQCVAFCTHVMSRRPMRHTTTAKSVLQAIATTNGMSPRNHQAANQGLVRSRPGSQQSKTVIPIDSGRHRTRMYDVAHGRQRGEETYKGTDIRHLPWSAGHH